MLAGTCHCGAVAYQIPRLPEQVTSCNCSICQRLGTICAYFRPDEVIIRPASGATDIYVWGDKMIEFHRCKICGVHTHWLPTELGVAGRMAVNARLLPSEVFAALKIRRFDGARTWKFLDE